MHLSFTFAAETLKMTQILKTSPSSVESAVSFLCSPVTVGSHLNPVHIFASYLFKETLHVFFHIFQVCIFTSGLSTTENVSRGYNLDVIWEVLF
jgi:hypothetical protein